MALIGLHAGTYAEYIAKKKAAGLVATDLYFTTDAPQRLFRGENPANEAWTLVTADPKLADMRAGVMYINKTTGKISVVDGDAVATIMPARVTAIDESTDAASLPTVGALKSYVSSISSGGFTAAAYVNEAEHVHSLKFTTAGGADTFVALPSGLADVAYDAATGKFTFTKYDGTTEEADTPLEKVLTAASYDPDTKKLTLTFNVAGTEEPIDIDLTGLVDTFSVTGAAEGPISVTSAEGLFTIDLTLADKSLSKSATGLKVALSATEGNQLTLAADGLFVAAPPAVDLTPYAKLADLASTEAAKGASLVGVSGTYVATTKTVEGVLANHETRLAATEGVANKAATDILALETRVGTAETDITALEGRMDTAEGKITTLEGQMTTAKGDITQLRTDVDAATAALTWKSI